jgi:arylsulfatase A-like enzyme
MTALIINTPFKHKYAYMILSIWFIVSGCHQTEQIEQQKPNVVIILSDDQGWGDLSMNGNVNLNTPNIDRIAKEGARFENFYVEAVCSPTRAEMLTGRYHSRVGVYSTSAGGERIDLDETTIADVFKQAGYATAAYGKWHSGMQYPYHPNARGFDDYYGFCSGHWGDYFNPMLEHNQELVTGEGFLVDDLTNHGIAFMEKNKDAPFLLYLPFNTPHSPMQVPDEYWNKFSGKELGMRSNSGNEENLEFTKAALAMCENIDWNVGRLLNKLEELELKDNTIVLYFSDNGPNSRRWNGEMKGRKGSTDEGGVRSPLVVKWPGKIPAGKTIEQISSVIDLLPTLTNMAGIKHNIRKPLDGVSLKALLLEENPSWSERLIFNQWKDKISVRSQKYRLGNEGGLYDIENDRGQFEDLSASFPEIKAQLATALEGFKNDVVSELPGKDLRTFPVGHPDSRLTQIPARDGVAHGNIQRSNRFPNCSFFTNWTSLEDRITWDVEVVEEGDFEVTLYYTCPEGDEGSVFELGFADNRLESRIETAFDNPLRGMENDRVERGESYVKDFKPLNIGTIHLAKGPGQLSLKALEIPGATVMDVRLLMFERMN